MLTTTTSMLAINNAGTGQTMVEDKEYIICNSVMTGFRNDTASTFEKVKYSECVQFIYPQDSNEPAPLWWKLDLLLMLLVIVMAIVVAVKRFDYSDDLLDRMFNSFFWVISGFLSWLLINGLLLILLYLIKG